MLAFFFSTIYTYHFAGLLCRGISVPLNHQGLMLRSRVELPKLFWNRQPSIYQTFLCDAFNSSPEKLKRRRLDLTARVIFRVTLCYTATGQRNDNRERISSYFLFLCQRFSFPLKYWNLPLFNIIVDGLYQMTIYCVKQINSRAVR